ncbi:hypothetical protein G6L37_03115 [Agrobacterium rubi]|nr:hypothetical protein [Agrobacterium rubi]NTF24365.1 hypothetical protein [Agrobacterium rubi]
MNAEMSFKSKFALLLRKSSDLTEDERSMVRQFNNRVVWWLAGIVALLIGWGYFTVFRDEPDGPARDLLLEVLNAFTIGLASGFAGVRIVCFASRLKATKAVPLSILAGAIFFFGGNLLFDVSMRMKADVAVSEVRSVAFGKLSKLGRTDQPVSDVRSAVTDASDYVRAFRDPD